MIFNIDYPSFDCLLLYAYQLTLRDIMCINNKLNQNGQLKEEIVNENNHK